MSTGKLLSIYLNDHLFLATGAVALARRAAAANPNGPFGSSLQEAARLCEEDRLALLALMDAAGVRPSSVKQWAAAAGERFGRLKLNGRLRGYSPLSRVVELEGLVLLLDAQRQMWDSLSGLEAVVTGLTRFDPASRASAAALAGARLDVSRREAAAIALGGTREDAGGGGA